MTILMFPAACSLLISVPFIAALPPTPLEDLLVEAKWIVAADVVEVMSQSPDNEEEKARYEARAGTGWTGPMRNLPGQTLRLRVGETIRGEAVANQELIVLKPLAPYLLEAGGQGVFFLAPAPVPAPGASPAPAWQILNIYGPYPSDRKDFIKEKAAAGSPGGAR